MQYKIIQAQEDSFPLGSRLPLLQKLVQEAINDGWVPLGNPFTPQGDYLSQAMVKDQNAQLSTDNQKAFKTDTENPV